MHGFAVAFTGTKMTTIQMMILSESWTPQSPSVSAVMIGIQQTNVIAIKDMNRMEIIIRFWDFEDLKLWSSLIFLLDCTIM
jgi:hypothetical protein